MMNYLYLLLFFIILLILFNYVYISYEQILYRIDSFVNRKNQSAVPTSLSISKELIRLLDDSNFKSYTFIDFGCGLGEVLSLVHPYFSTTVGIELDYDTSQKAIGRFINNTSVSILHMNMVDYDFKNIPTFLYMYEPLFLIDSKLAFYIYKSVVTKLKSKITTSEIYIVYVDSVHPILNVNFFINHGFQLIFNKRISKGLPFVYNTFHVFKSI